MTNDAEEGQMADRLEVHQGPRRRGRPSNASKEIAFEAARTAYRSSQRLDMTAIAADLGVGRVTLHRWFGTREDLASEILYQEYSAAFDSARRRAAGRGRDRIIDTLARLQAAIAGDAALAALLAEEPKVALRILTSSGGGFQPRVVESIAQLIRDAEREDGYRPPIDVDTLAYALVRVAEAFVYNDAVVGIKGELAELTSVQALLLDERT